jgi:hypothetical protein
MPVLIVVSLLTGDLWAIRFATTAEIDPGICFTETDGN